MRSSVEMKVGIPFHSLYYSNYTIFFRSFKICADSVAVSNRQ